MTSQLEQKNTSVWHYKPWWCQPWSIVSTGATIVSGSWLLFHKVWITLLVAVPILTWMGFFLLVYPRLFAQAMSEEIQKQP
ncbi:hypothetical protein H6G89_30455 [Oscillatoria sp. FACHB-1407]|uniref:DUF6737 family protein n=1 Tax=Oscillatoria sp. FACHB-1407 TaxID=2692847 RepID=UPI00168A17B8|nr:DUF6737 family protein [Oscillatoria sp. FACHB-1407]MBD2465336.1 hypothetical protein [Oscillatoria sp. FACHB-1407]